MQSCFLFLVQTTLMEIHSPTPQFPDSVSIKYNKNLSHFWNNLICRNSLDVYDFPPFFYSGFTHI